MSDTLAWWRRWLTPTPNLSRTAFPLPSSSELRKLHDSARAGGTLLYESRVPITTEMRAAQACIPTTFRCVHHETPQVSCDRPCAKCGHRCDDHPMDFCVVCNKDCAE